MDLVPGCSYYPVSIDEGCLFLYVVEVSHEEKIPEIKEFKKSHLSQRIKNLWCGPGFPGSALGIERDDSSLFIGPNFMGDMTILIDTTFSTSRKFEKLCSGLGGFCLALDSEGQVWSFGGNSKGQLGLGHLDRVDSPSMVKIDGFVTDISAGQEFSCCVTSSGELWNFGSNKFCQLGRHYDSEYRAEPSRVTVIDGFVTLVSCGNSHTLVLTDLGHVWSFGECVYGQTARYAGVLHHPLYCIPGRITTLEDIVMIQCSGDTSLATDKYGGNYLFGNVRNIVESQSGCLFKPREVSEWRNHQTRLLHFGIFTKSPEGVVEFYAHNCVCGTGIVPQDIVVCPDGRDPLLLCNLKSANKNQ